MRITWKRRKQTPSAKIRPIRTFRIKPFHITKNKNTPDFQVCFLAERAGFEPATGFKAGTHLAGEPIQPLWHLPKHCTTARLTIAIVIAIQESSTLAPGTGLIPEL